MSIQTRKQRELAERERLIVRTAHNLAEAEGWDAVTTRRLAAEIEYSEPVLYSHFSGKVGIMTAVAVAGFADLADALRTARTSARNPGKALTAVAAAYARFAETRPAQYYAMFTAKVELPFASPKAPPSLHEAFDELRLTLHPFAQGDDPETLAETFWSGLHGLVTLLHHGRLRPRERRQRLELLTKRFT
ncbi:MAG: TetR/AcrR family transcriptional regulator [bacterium]